MGRRRLPLTRDVGCSCSPFPSDVDMELRLADPPLRHHVDMRVHQSETRSIDVQVEHEQNPSSQFPIAPFPSPMWRMAWTTRMTMREVMFYPSILLLPSSAPERNITHESRGLCLLSFSRARGRGRGHDGEDGRSDGVTCTVMTSPFLRNRARPCM